MKEQKEKLLFRGNNFFHFWFQCFLYSLTTLQRIAFQSNGFDLLMEVFGLQALVL